MADNSIPFLAYHPDYVLNLPDRHRVPIDKYTLLAKQLLYKGIVDVEDFFEPKPADKKYLEPAHETDYLERALTNNLTRKEARRIGYPYDDYLIRRELRIVQGTLQASEVALQIGLGLNIAGGTHHAGSNWGEGFCMFNDIAVSAYNLLNAHHLRKILIIDLDVHQGNGTAEILRDEPRAFTFSMHAQKNFPFRKEDSDLDIGLNDGTKGNEYLSILQDNLEKLFKTQQPEFVFFLAGADVLHTDKLGRLELTREDCKERDRMVMNYCKSLRIPLFIGTAGGYSKRVANVVDVHSQTFEEAITTILY